jgi:hypothetical protein
MRRGFLIVGIAWLLLSGIGQMGVAETDIDVQALLNKRVYRGDGEEAKIAVRTNQSIYLHIISIAEDGTVTVLLPTRVVPRNRILGGQEFIFPNEVPAQHGPADDGGAAEGIGQGRGALYGHCHAGKDRSAEQRGSLERRLPRLDQREHRTATNGDEETGGVGVARLAGNHALL